jgi:DNA invertase Pin-like site-specific DNA recombinase
MKSLIQKLNCSWINAEDKEEVDVKYIIYVRKSTKDDSKQVQSIEDQLRLCKEYAEKYDFKIAKADKNFENKYELELWLEKVSDESLRNFAREYFVVIENESAKEAYKRPKWRKIIKWIKKWKIEGIISYHPDRQARNLLEAWELIDLLDKWYVDLKYSSMHFDKTTSSKMILWILFVLAKHYSDKLSDDVTRWIYSQLKKWKRKWVYKYWYYSDENWFFRPDPEYFDIVKKAFKMRLDWKSYKEIQYFLESNDIRKTKWENWKRKKIKKQWFKVKNILEDSFYCWIYKYVDKKKNKNICIDLRIIISIEFVPMITIEEYKKILELADSDIKPKNKNKWTEQVFSRWFIIASDGKNVSSFYSKPGKNSYKWYLERGWNLPIDDRIDEIKVRIELKSSHEVAKARKGLGKKNDFSLKELEDYVIKPALRLLDINWLYSFFNRWYELKVFEEIEKEKSKQLNFYKGQLLTCRRELKHKNQKLTLQDLSDDEINNLKNEIKLLETKKKLLEEYMKELELKSSKIKLEYNDFINKFKKLLLEDYSKLKVKSKKYILESIFEKIVIDVDWIKIYSKPEFLPFFKNRISGNLILSAEIPKKINRKK